MLLLQRLINALRIVTPSCADVVKRIRSEPWDPYQIRDSTRLIIDTQFERLDMLIDAWSDAEPTRRTKFPSLLSDTNWKEIELDIRRAAYHIIDALAQECAYLHSTFPDMMCVCMHVSDASCVLMYSIDQKGHERIPEFGHVARNYMGFAFVIEDAPVRIVDTHGLRAVFETYVRTYQLGGLSALYDLQLKRYRTYVAHLQAQHLDVDEPNAKKILFHVYPKYPRRANSLKRVTFVEDSESEYEAHSQ